MLRPEERDINGGSEPDPSQSPSSTSVTSDVGRVHLISMPATADDGRVDQHQVSSATNNGSEDRDLPTADNSSQPERDDPAPLSSPLAQSPHHGGAVCARGGIVGSRAYQFRKAKSAATFLLDGVSYTIGE